MQCANCEMDFKEDKEKKGFFTIQNPHFMKPYRVYGMVCPHCGFHNTVFVIPVPISFVRSARTDGIQDKIIEGFKDEITAHKERKLKKDS
jgi:hypothetical protein